MDSAELLISTQDGKLRIGGENQAGKPLLFDPEEIIREMKDSLGDEQGG